VSPSAVKMKSPALVHEASRVSRLPAIGYLDTATPGGRRIAIQSPFGHSRTEQTTRDGAIHHACRRSFGHMAARAQGGSTI
jgi:hypothetical protein